MAEPLDFSEYKVAAFLPQLTLDTYMDLPEDVCKQIEVVDGWIVRCERPRYSHQVIQHNLVAALREAAKQVDLKQGTCHRVSHDIDVLIADEPNFHLRCPDVVVYRCVTEDRGRWGDRPRASDCVLVLEIVSPDSVTTDLRDKRAEYAAAGIPHYWIVRMEDNDGPAMYIERFRLVSGGSYISEEDTVRRVDFHAVAMDEPFSLKLTWEELDDGL
jgi:Uma2 family endonuclease